MQPQIRTPYSRPTTIPFRRAAVAFGATFLLILGLAFAGSVVAEGETTTLHGQFHWDKRDVSGPLEARFTPLEEGLWAVAFDFEFREQPHTYTGTAEGNLENGKLSGEVVNENKKRTFTFEGTVTDGQFSGTHAELEDGKPFATGTLTLGR